MTSAWPPQPGPTTDVYNDVYTQGSTYGSDLTESRVRELLIKTPEGFLSQAVGAVADVVLGTVSGIIRAFGGSGVTVEDLKTVVSEKLGSYDTFITESGIRHAELANAVDESIAQQEVLNTQVEEASTAATAASQKATDLNEQRIAAEAAIRESIDQAREEIKVKVDTTAFDAAMQDNAAQLSQLGTDLSTMDSELESAKAALMSTTATASQALAAANGKSTNFYGAGTPTSPADGDTWFKPENGQIVLYQRVDGVWVKSVEPFDPSGIEAELAQNAQDIAAAMQDVAAAQAELEQNRADIAAAKASMTDLTQTVSSVDGKATTSGNAPTTSDASGKPEGAMWYVMDASGKLTATYVLKSGAWVKYAWASTAIADEVNQAISNAASAASTAQATADAAKSAAETNTNDLTSFINKTTDNLSSLQSQVDGSITTWFYDVAPTASNKPASDWTTTDLKNNHLGDLYYDTITGYCYRYQVTNNTYSWARISDVDVTKALSDAAKAQDTADAKRRVFTGTPSTPYDVGDLWVQGASGDILMCGTAKTGSQSYNAADWVKASKYTDDTLAGQAHQAAVTAQTSAVTAQTAADNAKALASTAQSTANLALANAQNMVMNTGNDLANTSRNNGVTAENGVYTRTFPGNENHFDFLWGSLSGKAIPGHTYSISIDARVVSGDYIPDDSFRFGWNDGWWSFVNVRGLSGDWQRFADKITVGGNGADAPQFYMSSYMSSAGAKVVQFRNLSIKDITEAAAAQATADTAKTIANAAQSAASAAQSSADAAQSAAAAAQTTADGKNKVIRSTSAPSSTNGYKAGDQWWVYSDSPITYDWTGAPNASTSTLSQDGTVVATNLYTVPSPNSSYEGYGMQLSDQDGALVLTSTDSTRDNWAHLTSNFALDAGNYVMNAEVITFPSGLSYRVAIENAASQVIAKIGSGNVGPQHFTIQSNAYEVRFAPVIDANNPVGSKIILSRLGIYTASDWQAMQALGVTWFSGDMDDSYPGVRAFYLFNGSSWVSQPLTDSVIANLDAGKITSGYVNADRIQAGSITGTKIAAGTITASNMVAGTLTAASGIIADAAIGSAQIIDGSIGSAEIADAAVGTAKIADAAISTAKIADAAITNAKIDSLDAGKITTGYVDAARIAANSITTDKLLVASTSDLCPNPFFDPSGPLLGKPHDWVPASGGHSRLLDSRDHVMSDSGQIKVQSGESYRITFEGHRVSGALMLNGGLWIGGTGTGIAPFGGMSASVDDGPCNANPDWHLYHIDYTVPTFPNATVTYGTPFLQLEQWDGGDTSWLVGALHVYRRSDASLIVDGSISTNKLVANAVTSDKIAAEAVTAREIQAGTITGNEIKTGSVTSDKLVIENGFIKTAMIGDGQIDTAKISDAAITDAKIANLDAGKITSGYVDAARIAANTITADKLLVGVGGDLSPNPTFDPSGPLLGTTHSWIPGNGGHAVQLTHRDNVFPESTAFPVSKGDVFYITCEAAHPAGSAPLFLGLWWTVSPSTATSIKPYSNLQLATDLGQSANNPDWHTYAATISVPTASDAVVTAARGYIQMLVDIPGQETSAQNTWLIGNYHLFKVSDGTLIADGSISTNKLVANAVTADKIGAEAVVAGKIAAGAVTAREIQANTITATHLTVAPGNLFPDPHFKDPSWPWNSNVQTKPNHGGELVLYANGTHNSAYFVPEGKWLASVTLVPGAEYTLTAARYADNEQTRRLSVRAGYKKYDGSDGWAWLGDLTTPGLGVYTTTMRFKAPEDMVGGLCTIGFALEPDQTAGMASIWNVNLVRAADASLIVDGAIEANKIKAGAIRADHLAANTLTAREIKAELFTQVGNSVWPLIPGTSDPVWKANTGGTGTNSDIGEGRWYSFTNKEYFSPYTHRVSVDPDLEYQLDVWLYSPEGSMLLVNVRDQNGYDAVLTGGLNNNAYVNSPDSSGAVRQTQEWHLIKMALPTSWKRYRTRVKFRPGVRSIYLHSIYGGWKEGPAGTCYIADMRLTTYVPPQAAIDEAQNNAISALSNASALQSQFDAEQTKTNKMVQFQLWNHQDLIELLDIRAPKTYGGFVDTWGSTSCPYINGGSGSYPSMTTPYFTVWVNGDSTYLACKGYWIGDIKTTINWTNGALDEYVKPVEKNGSRGWRFRGGNGFIGQRHISVEVTIRSLNRVAGLTLSAEGAWSIFSDMNRLVRYTNPTTIRLKNAVTCSLDVVVENATSPGTFKTVKAGAVIDNPVLEASRQPLRNAPYTFTEWDGSIDPAVVTNNLPIDIDQ